MVITVTPTSTLPTGVTLVDPAEVLSRLSLPEAQTSTAQRLAARASATLVRALGYSPYYQAWRQEWRREYHGERYGQELQVEPRPVVSVTQVSDGASAPTIYVAGTDFTVVSSRRASGEASLLNPAGWEVYDVPGVDPDWIVTLTAGWWTAGMSGAIPAGASMLPEDLQEAAWLIAKDAAEADAANGSIESVARADAKVVFRQRPSGPGGNLPAGVTDLIAPYKALVF